MALVDRDISAKPVITETVLDVLNREIVPVTRMIRSAVNESSYTLTFGDGVATAFTFSHGLNTRALSIMVYDASTFDVLDITGLTVVLTDLNTLDVSGFGAPPTAGEFVMVVKR